MIRVLVADDVQQNRYMLTALLQGHGYVVDACGNGAEALALAQRTPPDLIISDLLMPVMDGFELCRQWKKDPALKRVPFIVYTATYTDPKDERLALSLGADLFLTKPQTVEALLAAVTAMLERRARGTGGAVESAATEVESLREHNEALVRKLTKKVHELEGVLKEYERAEAARKELQKQLAAAQRLDSIGRLASGVAHDFNNLLTVVLSHASFALGGLPPEHPIRAEVEEIRKAGERASALTRQLLAFSRKQVLEPELLSLNDVVGGIDSMLRRLLGSHIRVALRLAPDLGNVVADPGQLEQVIMNLAINARDAMPSGGQLTLETSNVEVDDAYAQQHVAVTPGPYVVLTVSDSGCGMDEATRERIFEPFFTTKGPAMGTGLGLSIVHGIVKQSGGHIWVYSEPGQGSTFKVYLPRSWDGPAARTPRAAPEVTRGSETVLLVEDNDAVRFVTERILRSAGYSVIAHADAEVALTECEQLGANVRLLITDLVMPRMSGRELSERMSARLPHLKTLFMSGYTDTDLGPDTHFLGKPFTAADLVCGVRQALDS